MFSDRWRFTSSQELALGKVFPLLLSIEWWISMTLSQFRNYSVTSCTWAEIQHTNCWRIIRKFNVNLIYPSFWGFLFFCFFFLSAFLTFKNRGFEVKSGAMTLESGPNDLRQIKQQHCVPEKAWNCLSHYRVLVSWKKKVVQELSFPKLSENLLDSDLYLYIDLYRYKQVTATNSRLGRQKAGYGDEHSKRQRKQSRAWNQQGKSSYFQSLNIYIYFFFISSNSLL